MTLEDRVQAQRLHVFRRAEELGNVSGLRVPARARLLTTSQAASPSPLPA